MGTIALICAGVSTSESMPFSRIAFTRRASSRRSWRLWARLSTPRWLSMMLKLSSRLKPS